MEKALCVGFDEVQVGELMVGWGWGLADLVGAGIEGRNSGAERLGGFVWGGDKRAKDRGRTAGGSIDPPLLGRRHRLQFGVCKHWDLGEWDEF